MGPTADTPVLFQDNTAEGLQRLLAPYGVSVRLARRLQGVVLQRGGGEVPAALPEVPRRLLEERGRRTRVPRLTLVEKALSPRDGFAKSLSGAAGPEPFEAVRIPLLHRPG